MPTTADGTTINNLRDAIKAYQATASKMFVEARDELASPPKPQAGEKAEDAARRIDEANKKSQGKLAAAFSQLANAETMLSAQVSREGYEQVVKLFTKTAVTAKGICDQLDAFVIPVGSINLTGSNLSEKLEIIRVLTSALHALAAISPTAVLQNNPPSGGAAG